MFPLNSTQPSLATESVTTEREAVTRASLFLQTQAPRAPTERQGSGSTQLPRIERGLTMLRCCRAPTQLIKEALLQNTKKIRHFKLATHFSQAVHQSLKLSCHSTLRRGAAFLHSTISQNASDNGLQQVLVPWVDGLVQLVLALVECFFELGKVDDARNHIRVCHGSLVCHNDVLCEALQACAAATSVTAAHACA